MPYLIQKARDGSPVKQWDVKGAPLSVGRGDNVNAKIDDPKMSREHFVISQRGTEYLLNDSTSRNGTLVNGRRVSEAVLHPEDKIIAGDTHFVFVEGLGTIISQLEKEPKGYGTQLREISNKFPPKSA